MRAVLVGEAYGRREKARKHPLVGPSGRELTLEMGAADFTPYIELLCRKCKRLIPFNGIGHCPHCFEHSWPNELNLIHHWKRMREEQGVAVTNVFNEQPPEICNTCGSMDISFFGKPRCKTCKSWDIRTNDLGWFFGTDDETPMPPMKASKYSRGTHVKKEFYDRHVKRLWREIADLNPNLIIAMGNSACWALIGQTKISNLRGTITRTDKELTGLDIKVLPIFHPAAVLRQTPMRVTNIADFQKAKREIEFVEVRRPERFMTIPAPNASGIEEVRRWLRVNRGRRLANDIETIRGQISIVGFASSPYDALVIPFRDAHTKDGKIIDVGRIAEFIGFPNNGINYWPSLELEFAAWKLVQEVEESHSEKVYQNGLYDMSHLFAFGRGAGINAGFLVRNAKHDTMLWHHSRYPELPKSLRYLGSIYCNDISWKEMSRADNLKRDE